MDIRDERNGKPRFFYICKNPRRLFRRNGDPYYIASRIRKLFHLPESGIKIKRVGICHRLNRNGKVRADGDVSDLHLFCFSEHLKPLS